MEGVQKRAAAAPDVGGGLNSSQNASLGKNGDLTCGARSNHTILQSRGYQTPLNNSPTGSVKILGGLLVSDFWLKSKREVLRGSLFEVGYYSGGRGCCWNATPLLVIGGSRRKGFLFEVGSLRKGGGAGWLDWPNTGGGWARTEARKGSGWPLCSRPPPFACQEFYFPYSPPEKVSEFVRIFEFDTEKICKKKCFVKDKDCKSPCRRVAVDLDKSEKQEKIKEKTANIEIQKKSDPEKCTNNQTRQFEPTVG